MVYSGVILSTYEALFVSFRGVLFVEMMRFDIIAFVLSKPLCSFARYLMYLFILRIVVTLLLISFGLLLLYSSINIIRYLSAATLSLAPLHTRA